MKIPRLIRFGLICAFSLLALSAVEAGTEMDRAFGRLERDYKKLKTALEAPTDAGRELYVKITGEMLDEARKARELDPEMISQVPEAEREKFLEGFRAEMDAFIANIGKLEEALKTSRWDESRQLMETLWQNKKDGHRAFIKRKKK
jgi:hypothetical protein